MQSYENFPGNPPKWTCTNGEPFVPANFKPAIDTTGNLYGIKLGDGDCSALVIHCYESYRARSARDFGVWAWPNEKDWRPPVDERTVRCLGEVCCNSQPVELPASDWQLTKIKDGELLARQTIGDENSAERLEIGEEHLLYASYYPKDTAPKRTRHLDIMLAAIERFGAPYNPITGAVSAPFSNIYDSQNK
jgi:hypothetical protein